MMSKAQLSLATTGSPSRSPKASGRMPHGSRKAYRARGASTVTEKAPRMRRTAARTAASRPPAAEAPAAMSAAITSVSPVLSNRTPAACNSSRSSPAFTRLPFWPTATLTPPPARISGCAFCQLVAPVVE